MGVYGNEQVDNLATSSHNLEQTTARLPYKDFYSQVRTCLKLLWQSEWDQETENKLHLIKPTLGIWASS